MKVKVAILIGLVVALPLAVVSVHSAAGSNQKLVALTMPRQLASVKTSSKCDKNPTNRTRNQVPVWVHLEIRTDSGVLQREVGTWVAPFKLIKHHMHRMRKHEFGAWSGCLAVKLYTKGHVPTQMCAAKVLNVEPTSVNCGPVQTQGAGDKFVSILLSIPNPPAKCPDPNTGVCTSATQPQCCQNGTTAP